MQLSETSANGLARVVEIHDLRGRTHVETDDWGLLKIHRRKGGEVSWDKSLPNLISFLKKNRPGEIAVYLCVGPATYDSKGESKRGRS